LSIREIVRASLPKLYPNTAVKLPFRTNLFFLTALPPAKKTKDFCLERVCVAGDSGARAWDGIASLADALRDLQKRANTFQNFGENRRRELSRFLQIALAPIEAFQMV
jgi:hypothetical protein